MKYKIGDKFERRASHSTFKTGMIVAIRDDGRYILTVDGHGDDKLDESLEPEFMVTREEADLDTYYKPAVDFFEVGHTYRYEGTQGTHYRVTSILVNEDPILPSNELQALATREIIGECKVEWMLLNTYIFKSMEEVYEW